METWIFSQFTVKFFTVRLVDLGIKISKLLIKYAAKISF